jgi:hypothetical protein
VGEDLQQARRRLIALALGIAVQASAPAVQAAPSGDAEIVEARLEIDTRSAGTGAEVLHRRIEERANIVLRRAKILPGDHDDAALLIKVRELDGDEPGYSVTFDLRAADGSPLAESRVVECSLCTETELVARVEAELEAEIQSLREVESPPAASSTISETPAPQPETPSGPQPPRRHAGMLASGVALLVVGSGAIGTGVGLSIRAPRIDPDNPLDLITTRPVGYALLAGGVVAAATGAVLTAIGVERRRQPQWSVAPFGDRSRAGLVLGWRF